MEVEELWTVAGWRCSYCGEFGGGKPPAVCPACEDPDELDEVTLLEDLDGVLHEIPEYQW